MQGSILNGFKHFLLPALAPVVYPLGVITVRGVAGSGRRGRAGLLCSDRRHLGIQVPGRGFGFRCSRSSMRATWPCARWRGRRARGGLISASFI